MTIRQLTESAKDIGGQSREDGPSNGLSDRSSTLPSYEDAVGNMAASATGDAKVEGGDVKNKQAPPPSGPESDDSLWPPAREVRVHEYSSTIHGTYPIYDLLDISTVSGEIRVTVEPKPGNKTAVVRIKSRSGAIHVRFAKPALSRSGSETRNEKDASKRVYSTQIYTMSGQIHADILHGGAGGETVLGTKSGMLNLRITPTADDASRIETSTMSGLTKVTIEVPTHGGTLKNLTALHKSRTSGMLDVNYPREWEGRVHALCRGTGSVDVNGEGLHLQGGGRDVYAWRGHDALINGKIVEIDSEGTGAVRFKA